MRAVAGSTLRLHPDEGAILLELGRSSLRAGGVETQGARERLGGGGGLGDVLGHGVEALRVHGDGEGTARRGRGWARGAGRG